MDKTLPLARSEGDIRKSSGASSQDKLLARRGTSIPEGASDNRNKRKETATTIKKAKGRKAKDTSPASEVSAEAKVPNGDSYGGAESGGHRLHDKDRKSDRGAERADKAPRRSSAELGVTWIGDYCPDGQPHFLIGRHNFDGGVILNCLNCGKNLWLPIHVGEAAKLDTLIDHYGATRGYQMYLDKHREAKCMVAKMQDLQRAKERMENNEEFVKLVISIMEDKEYDRILEL